MARAIAGAAGTISRAGCAEGCDSLMALKGFVPTKRGLHC